MPEKPASPPQNTAHLALLNALDPAVNAQLRTLRERFQAARAAEDQADSALMAARRTFLEACRATDAARTEYRHAVQRLVNHGRATRSDEPTAQAPQPQHP